MMAVQVDRHSWPFPPRGFKITEEDKVLTGTDLVYYSSKIHFEYLTKHEECLIYVANISVFEVVLLSDMN